MKSTWHLAGEGRRLLSLAYSSEKGQGERKVSPVLSVGDVCRLLRRSRRQVYRYINGGNLKPCARIMDQWLFAKGEVERFQRDKLPLSFRPLFWDAKLSDVDPRSHRDFVLSRILEYGDRDAIRWAFHEYPRREFMDFLKKGASRLLSRRSLVFWTSYLGVKFPAYPARRDWQQQARRWGGLS